MVSAVKHTVWLSTCLVVFGFAFVGAYCFFGEGMLTVMGFFFSIWVTGIVFTHPAWNSWLMSEGFNYIPYHRYPNNTIQ